MKRHATFMRRAMEAARQAWGCTHPNPMVGAVVVSDGRIIAEGYHARAGGPHAEVEVLEKVRGIDLSDATLYVTLEPCSTKGRTPPCTSAILKSGIKKVVVGAIDPSPKHRGRGVRILEERGVAVTTGVCDSECFDLNLIFQTNPMTDQDLTNSHQIRARVPVAIQVAPRTCARLSQRGIGAPISLAGGQSLSSTPDTQNPLRGV